MCMPVQGLENNTTTEACSDAYMQAREASSTIVYYQSVLLKG